MADVAEIPASIAFQQMEYFRSATKEILDTEILLMRATSNRRSRFALFETINSLTVDPRDRISLNVFSDVLDYCRNALYSKDASTGVPNYVDVISVILHATNRMDGRHLARAYEYTKYDSSPRRYSYGDRAEVSTSYRTVKWGAGAWGSGGAPQRVINSAFCSPHAGVKQVSLLVASDGGDISLNGVGIVGSYGAVSMCVRMPGGSDYVSFLRELCARSFGVMKVVHGDYRSRVAGYRVISGPALNDIVAIEVFPLLQNEPAGSIRSSASGVEQLLVHDVSGIMSYTKTAFAQSERLARGLSDVASPASIIQMAHPFGMECSLNTSIGRLLADCVLSEDNVPRGMSRKLRTGTLIKSLMRLFHFFYSSGGSGDYTDEGSLIIPRARSDLALLDRVSLYGADSDSSTDAVAQRMSDMLRSTSGEEIVSECEKILRVIDPTFSFYGEMMWVTLVSTSIRVFLSLIRREVLARMTCVRLGFQNSSRLLDAFGGLSAEAASRRISESGASVVGPVCEYLMDSITSFEDIQHRATKNSRFLVELVMFCKGSEKVTGGLAGYSFGPLSTGSSANVRDLPFGLLYNARFA